VENVVAISINHVAPEHVVLQSLANGQASQTATADQNGASSVSAATAEANPAPESPPQSDQVTAHPGLVALASGTLPSGVGGQVQPNLDGDGARLQALQLQQQLRSLTAPIANQAPQALLALLR
jgi:flagellin